MALRFSAVTKSPGPVIVNRISRVSSLSSCNESRLTKMSAEGKKLKMFSTFSGVGGGTDGVGRTVGVPGASVADGTVGWGVPATAGIVGFSRNGAGVGVVLWAMLLADHPATNGISNNNPPRARRSAQPGRAKRFSSDKGTLA